MAHLDVRYQKFIEELRCPKCQNQNLAGSNSPISEDLRREIYRLIDDGKSDTEIVQFMLDRYGDFILYRPRLTSETAILWAAPARFASRQKNSTRQLTGCCVKRLHLISSVGLS